jgi:hypothetical protein
VSGKENPVPRCRAGGQANSDIKREYNTPSANDREAHTAGLASRFVPAAVACVLAALASLGAFQ